MAPLLDLLLPPACVACGTTGEVMCRRCRAAMAAPDPGAFVAADGGVVIGDAALLAVGALEHRGPPRAALGRLKYAGAARACGPLAAAAIPALARLLDIAGTGAVLVPVPLHAARRRQRGYNQAELLARALSDEVARLGVQAPTVADLLVRAGATERQHRLDRAARLRNLRDVIRPRPGIVVSGVTVVIDDILTTAATIEACAGALRAAGSPATYGFAIAREV